MDELPNKLARYFGVELIDYQRSATGILISSGCGIGLALMDTLASQMRFYFDVDNYRYRQIDWECVALILSAAKPTIVVLAGWFTFDTCDAFDTIERAIASATKPPLMRYNGGGDVSLATFIDMIKAV